MESGNGQEAMQILKDNGLRALYGEVAESFQPELLYTEYIEDRSEILSSTAYADLKSYITAEQIQLDEAPKYEEEHRY